MKDYVNSEPFHLRPFRNDYVYLPRELYCGQTINDLLHLPTVYICESSHCFTVYRVPVICVPQQFEDHCSTRYTNIYTPRAVPKASPRFVLLLLTALLYELWISYILNEVYYLNFKLFSMESMQKRQYPNLKIRYDFEVPRPIIIYYIEL